MGSHIIPSKFHRKKIFSEQNRINVRINNKKDNQTFGNIISFDATQLKKCSHYKKNNNVNVNIIWYKVFKHEYTFY